MKSMDRKGGSMWYRKNTWLAGIVLFVFIFLCSGNAVLGNEEMETVYYYIVQPGDNLWKISEELYGDGSNWKWLYDKNSYIFDPALIYPGWKLEISSWEFPENADERFMTEERKKTNFEWLKWGYVHYNDETPKRDEYPEKVEKEALRALKEGTVEDWLKELLQPRILTEEEKESYRKKDSEDILYSYEIEIGMPEDIWYSLTESDGSRWLIIENMERGKSQEFYLFMIDSATGEIVGKCEKIHGAGGRLYLTSEDGILIWILTKETGGDIVGVAGDYRGCWLYIGGNFYYEKQKNGTVKEAYQSYASIGNGTLRDPDAVWEYPY